MIFKNLEERFDLQVNKLYGKYSTNALVEVKPNDPERDSRRGDSWTNPDRSASAKQDTLRLTKWLGSSDGKIFISTQKVLQNANSISETRKLNTPKFILEKNSMRSVNTQMDFLLAGNGKSPASRLDYGYIGRLQKSTSINAIKTATNVISGATILDKAINKIGLGKILGQNSSPLYGTLGVNDRPELDINGQYYIVMLWKKDHLVSPGQKIFGAVEKDLRKAFGKQFTQIERNIANKVKSGIAGFITSKIFKTGGIQSRISLSNLPVPKVVKTALSKNGIFSGTAQVLQDLFNSTLRGIKNSAIQTAQDAVGHMISSSPLKGLFGNLYSTRLNLNPLAYSTDFVQKYFIQDEDPKNNKTYLTGNMKYLEREPVLYYADSRTPATIISAGKILGHNRYLSIGALGIGTEEFLGVLPDGRASRMTEAQDSLESRYEESNREEGVSSRKTRYQQIQSVFEKENTLGIVGGFDSKKIDGSYSEWDLRQKTASLPRRRYYAEAMGNDNVAMPGYLHDTLNMLDPRSTEELPVDDLVNLVFEEIYPKNRKTRIRALISSLIETVTPTYNSQPYIGRIEKNITYSDVTRNISFNLRLHALSADELIPIWKKINYLTSLTYPIEYANGHVVPPIMRLTIGDMHNKNDLTGNKTIQGVPGYITSLTYTTDDDISWETALGHQVPHGVSVAISFDIIEQDRMISTSNFYGYGNDTILTKQSLGSIASTISTAKLTMEDLTNLANANIPSKTIQSALSKISFGLLKP